MNILNKKINKNIQNVYDQGYMIQFILISTYLNKYDKVIKERWKVVIYPNIPHIVSLVNKIEVNGFGKYNTLLKALNEWNERNDFTLIM